MRADNQFYGHDAVLRTFVGIDGAPPIWGVLQHGWNPGTGFPSRYPLAGRMSKFVWSSFNREQALAAGGRSIVPIGAPFAYAVTGATPSAPSPRTIVYPHHSAPGRELDDSHDAYAQMLLEREGPDATVCLYWLDLERPRVREAYEALGLRVICHGSRDDPEFLHRQISELQSHTRVVSNRVSTAVFYGASLGLEAEVYGPTWSAEGEVESRHFESVQHERWPELVAGGISGPVARETGERELGFEHLREPGELAEILGWTGPRLQIGRFARPALRARAAAKRSLLPTENIGLENRREVIGGHGPIALAVFVTLWGQPSETFVRREVEALADRGHRLSVVSLRTPLDVDSKMPSYSFSKAQLLNGILRSTVRHPGRVLRVLRRVVRGSRRENLVLHLGAAGWGIAVASLLPGAEMAHAHFAWLAATSADAYAELRGIRRSVFPHAFDVFETRMDEPYLGSKLRRADVLVVESEAMRRHLLDVHGVDSTVLKIGVPAEVVVDDVRPVNGEPPLLVSVGMLRDKKGHDVLLRAVATIPGLRCEIVGEGPERLALESLIAGLGIGDRASLLGPLSVGEVFDALDRATLFCLASRVGATGDMDGIPNVLIEAMARGVPVVSTRLSGIPDLVTPDRGILCTPDHPEELAESIRSVLEDPAAATGRARRALTHVREEYVVETNVVRLEELFLAALSDEGVDGGRR